MVSLLPPDTLPDPQNIANGSAHCRQEAREANQMAELSLVSISADLDRSPCRQGEVLQHAAPHPTPYVCHVHLDPLCPGTPLPVRLGEDALVHQKPRRQDDESPLQVLRCQDLDKTRNGAEEELHGLRYLYYTR